MSQEERRCCSLMAEGPSPGLLFIGASIGPQAESQGRLSVELLWSHREPSGAIEGS